ncbi:DNA polymerase IV, partial [Streptomyces sp. SID9727]|nr:DNA polymerase IV [Streptomyces sp. SID9727]
VAAAEQRAARRWPAGHDVLHEVHGHGWVQGSGVGRVTVRFEEPGATAPGRVRTFRVDDPALRAADPLPLVPDPPDYSSWPASRPKSRSGAGAPGAASRP